MASEASLKSQIAELKRQLFGQSRERFVPQDGEFEVALPLEASEKAKVAQEEKLRSQKGLTTNTLAEPNYL